MNENKIVVVGGGAAGFTVALSAKKYQRKSEVTLITKEKNFYSRCALPFVISGEITSFSKISHNIKEMCREVGVNCVVDEVVKINPQRKKVKTKQGEFSYSSLIIATGSDAFVPPIKGRGKRGIFTLKTIGDGREILGYAKKEKVKKVVVIGGGAIGVEIASALRKARLEVTVVELLNCLLPGCLSPDFSQIIAERLKKGGITIITGTEVKEILGKERVSGVMSGGKEIPAGMIIIGTGVKAEIKLAQEAGIEIERGAIKVNERMETSVPGIWAAGDCVSFKNLITGKPTLSQLGTTAIREGKIAGINAVGGNEKIEGILSSIVLKILELEVGKTGLNEEEAKKEGFPIIVGKIKTSTKEDYYPGSKDLWIKIIFNRESEEVLGCEVIGGEGVAEKIDLMALSIQKKATIKDIINLDYCYTPPIITDHNALVLAAENAQRKLRRIKREQH